jgi:hypothetical protein
VKNLKQDAFAHETLERGGPAFADHLKPLEVDDTERNLGEASDLASLLGERTSLLDDEIDVAAGRHAVGEGQAIRAAVALAGLASDKRGEHEYTNDLEPASETISKELEFGWASVKRRTC